MPCSGQASHGKAPTPLDMQHGRSRIGARDARLSGTTNPWIRISNSRYTSAFSRPGDARDLRFVVPRNNEGAGNAGCALHPRSRVQRAERKSHTSIQGSGGDPTFPAQWLYDLYRALPGVSGFAASVALRKPALPPGWAFAPPKDLTPTTEASEPHDFAVRSAPLVGALCDRSRSLSRPAIPSRARCRRVDRLPSQRSVTMANAPSSGTGWRES